jgi:hypothetical protein
MNFKFFDMIAWRCGVIVIFFILYFFVINPKEKIDFEKECAKLGGTIVTIEHTQTKVCEDKNHRALLMD